MPDRFVQRTSNPQSVSVAFDKRAGAFWQVSPTAMPFNFADPDAKHARGLVALDNDPNTTEPNYARVTSNRCAALGIYAVCDVEVGLEVWIKPAGLTDEGDPAWVCIRRAITVAPSTRVVVPVDVHWNEAFVRVVSGPSAGHPLDLFVAVC